jgi:hypothetical protein
VAGNKKQTGKIIGPVMPIKKAPAFGASFVIIVPIFS